MELRLDRVGKQYKGGFWALREFSLVLEPGILGLLGPNGAGKSTLMRILATVTRPTEGMLFWDGSDILRSPDRVREILGYLPQDFGIYPNLNAVEFLEYLAAARGLSGRDARRRIDALLETVNLSEARRRPIGGFSGGMKQRLGIAQALLNNPKLLIVDEPTVGLDPEERVRFRNLLADLGGDRIVILSTHIVSDVEAAASSIALIDHGRLVTHAPPEVLLAAARGNVWEWLIPSIELTEARRRFRLSGALRRGDGVLVRVLGPLAPGPGATPAVPTLEDAYMLGLSATRAETAPS
jgi:ABC-type multidrug transport system ATPase subunit